jgi:hypothetical protein
MTRRSGPVGARGAERLAPTLATPRTPGNRSAGAVVRPPAAAGPTPRRAPRGGVQAAREGCSNTPGNWSFAGVSDEVHPVETSSVLLASACKPARAGELVTWRVVRVACDWAKCLMRAWVTERTWQALCVHLAVGGFDLVLPDGECVSLKLRQQGDQLVAWGGGVRLVVRREPRYQAPRTTPADPVRALNQRERVERARAAVERARQQEPYGVELDISGTALSASATGLDVVAAVRTAVEGLLFPERGVTAAARRAALAPLTFPGRFDLAVDVAVTGSRASDWIEGTLYRHGHLDRARRDWSSRARNQKGVARHAAPADVGDRDEQASIVGRARKGRTLYFGSNPLLRVYERDRKTDGDWPVLASTLRDLGWSPSERLIRSEFEIKREWLRDQEIGGVRGDRLTFDGWVAALPTIVRELTTRYRHVEGKTRGTRGAVIEARRRPTSRYWSAVMVAVEQFGTVAEGEAMARPFGKVRAVKRAVRVAAAVERGARVIALLEAAGHTQHEALRMILAARNDPREAERYATYIQRLERELEVREVTCQQVGGAGTG